MWLPPGFLFCRLLDFDIVAVDSTQDTYVLTANLRLETKGSEGVVGGGPTQNHQARLKLTRVEALFRHLIESR